MLTREVEPLRNQRDHHTRGTTHERLERITQEEAAEVEMAQADPNEKGRERP